MPYKMFDNLMDQFDPTRGIEDSHTPPYQWYTDQSFYDIEVERIFQKCWLPIGRLDQVDKPGRYFTGEICGNPYVVVRGEDSQLYAHHNVCRHKGAIVAQCEDNTPHRCAFFQCPFHGWEYHHNGKLKKAPMLGQQKNFKGEHYGLSPICIDTWGPMIFADLDGPFGGDGNPRSLQSDVADLNSVLETKWSHLKFFTRKVYEMNCNWKVFVDNSLDGCYHCIYAHEQLAEGLDLSCFETIIHKRSSIQRSKTNGQDKRLGDEVSYCYLYPNLFINRYGNMMDVNIVEPLGVNKCRVIFDYYFDFENLDDWQAKKRMRDDIASSHIVQRQDVDVCESVQKGMESVSFRWGRYSSQMEQACYAFHVLHWHELRGFRK